jgi:hypothetical protein
MVSACSLAVSRSDLISIFAKGSTRYDSSGRGSIVSSLSSLSKFIVFRAFASRKRVYDPILFLRL